MLQFDTVQKHYGNFLALNIPSLTLADGVYWLQGENGSGKTSFLKMIGGLHPFTGDISLGDYSIKKDRVSYLQKINYAEAEPLYPSFLTGKDLVKLYCETKKTNEQQSLQLLEQLHIADAYNKPVGTYSSGMLKKLSLVLAFTGDPKWILLDEPLITLDTNSVAIICSLINTLHKEKSVSFIITSHQPFQDSALHLTGTLAAAHQTISLTHA
ncbi:MAG: ATP-binding cassette domain-containing protein [Sediminibacterium sp.]